MSKEDNLNRLINIFSWLEISARDWDNELNTTRELIGRLHYARHRAPRAVVVVEPTPTETYTRVGDRSLDLIDGVDIHICD